MKNIFFRRNWIKLEFLDNFQWKLAKKFKVYESAKKNSWKMWKIEHLFQFLGIRFLRYASLSGVV